MSELDFLEGEDIFQYVERLRKIIIKQNERIAELEEEISQSDEILAEHDLANYKIITNQSKRIVELEAKLAGSNYTLNLSLRKYKELNESQAIRNLEQQAEAVNILYKNGKCDADSWLFIKAKGGAK